MLHIILQLTSLTLVTGLFICLRSAAKITHRAQAITCLAAKWHACATINFDDFGDDIHTPTAHSTSQSTDVLNANFGSDNEEVDEDELDNTNMMPIYAHTISYQKRQALGKLINLHIQIVAIYSVHLMSILKQFQYY